MYMLVQVVLVSLCTKNIIKYLGATVTLCRPLISIKWAICCVTMRSFSVIKVNFVKGKTMLRYVSQGVE